MNAHKHMRTCSMTNVLGRSRATKCECTEENVHTSKQQLRTDPIYNGTKNCGHRNKTACKKKWGGGYPNFLCTITFSYHIFLNSTCMLNNAVNLCKYGTVLKEA